MFRWYQLGFWLEIDNKTPDGNSARTLVLNTHIPSGRFTKFRIPIRRWDVRTLRGQWFDPECSLPAVEVWLSKHGIYPSW